MRLVLQSLLQPAATVALHEGDEACLALLLRTRRATLFALVVIAASVFLGRSIEPSPPVLVGGAILFVLLVLCILVAGRTRTVSAALLIGFSSTMGVLLGTFDGVRTTAFLGATNDGYVLAGAGLTCALALFAAELLHALVARPSVSLFGPIFIGALAPWSSSLGFAFMAPVGPLGAFVGATVALTLVLSARLADVALPYVCARDEGVSGALLRFVELPRFAWVSLLGERGPENLP
jgi:hypothetical protein